MPGRLSSGRARFLARKAYLAGRRAVSVVVERFQGIETASAVDLSDLDADAPGRVRYEPSGWLSLKRSLRARDVKPGDVFLDYGCGKGRVLVAAARLPFERVMGVELAPELAEVARANLEADRGKRRAKAVEVVAADVTQWDVPDDVTVAFMFNPFRGAVFEAALAQLFASLERNPRPLRLIYSVPMEEEALLATGRARLVRSVAGLRPGREWSRKMGVREFELR